jgi:hypothetical protein
MNLRRTFGCAIIGFLALMEPAFAAEAVPGPIAGIGLPALALIGGAYWLGRKLIARGK